MPNEFNQQIIEEFRANQGRVGGMFEGARLLLLTTVGARSGAPHTTPVGYLPDGGERVLVIASAAGSPKHPDWFRNLVAHPRVTVEDGVFTYEAEATVLEGAERDLAFARAAEADPGWADYQARTSRVIPVVALRQVAGGPPNASSWGAALKLIHDAFRRELALIRKEVAASGPGLGAQLRINCLTLCQGLHHHHTNEDAGMFSALAGQRPDLAPVLDRLGEEHQRVAVLLDELQKAVSAEGADPQAVLSEVERLAGELEAHLAYEEEQLIPVLDAPAS
ncbi:nitroreductase/quinone reductase family protein [Planomonospora venezuelensis]|uniref:Deazaflavin-dependent oxidoreductase (Nitroreductase family) n=1 Tax=Planomonospora venezuelensis TaxID=1999 RepID=A0A841DEI6_PLAVE|nr:nitroreductase/quinone reductase family protein [Planomonospora venezuelensis]MBB5967327.1 deazaflavin-dependent oxidoreductase (nitroreductase family) [Planomonospora venezuelensis]GIN04717.1 cation-binding protein [Planomonospora venezuelensis]